jgi:PAS domain S-box-containing protein
VRSGNITRSSAKIWATPLIGIILFVFAMGGLLYGMYMEDRDQSEIRITRDIITIQNDIQTRLSSHREHLEKLASDLRLDNSDYESFTALSIASFNERHGLSAIMIVSPDRYVTHLALPPMQSPDVPHPLYQQIDEFEDTVRAFNTVRDSHAAVYTKPIFGKPNIIEIHVPILRKNKFRGDLIAVVSLESLLNYPAYKNYSEMYQLSIIDEHKQVLASNVTTNLKKPKLQEEVNLYPPGQGIKLRATLYRTNSELLSNMLVWIVFGLSIVIVWSFVLLLRHAKLRNTAEERLLEETKFRRAMEDSMVTGMRAIDLQGRITYVNPAFCKMTGFDEHELINTRPPFPYWPDNSEEQQKYIDLVLAGQAPSKGIQVQVQRKDGSQFTARLYVSPLIDRDGSQNGWMTSMVDITEPKRIREELAAAHRRFVRILEELDAAVSIRAPESTDDEYIFVNRLHREWFSQSSPPRLLKTDQQTKTDFLPFEWFNLNTQRWFEVRRRTISWVDGTTVIMQVTTDITTRKEAEEMSRQQLEKLQFTSRLITLGELASSLAHEINQPLAAISNYNTGCVNRLKSGRATPDQLLPVLEKVTVQAQRAGDVIRRIREFVKQQAPNRTACPIKKIVDDAIGFSQLEARRRSARIEQHIEDPELFVQADSVLIEQVLTNLIKNGLEAMGKNAIENRQIEIQVKTTGHQARVEVRDYGSGVPESIRDRLFESFFTTKSEGMGMGLNICRTIIEYHKGQLWMEPANGLGSVFIFTLPLATPTITKPSNTAGEAS